MTAIPVTSPVSMGKSKLTLGTDDITLPVSGVEVTPATQAPWKGIGGNRIIKPADWTMKVTAVQDTAPAGLLRYAMDHVGEAKDFRLEPEAGGPALTGTLTIPEPSKIGGSAKSTSAEEFDLTCDLTARPEWDDTPGA